MVFDRLDPLFKSQFRHTETMDTRQEIKRQHKDGKRKNHEDSKDKDNGPSLWEDSTTVSTAALHMFLKKLVEKKNSSDKASKTHISETARDAAAKDNQNSSPADDPQARKAANAYQRTYRATHNEEELSVSEDAVDAQALLISAEERRLIHSIIADLETLIKKDIQYLTIEKADSFLRGIANAIDALKS